MRSLFKTREHVWHAGIVDYNSDTGQTIAIVQTDDKRLYTYKGINLTALDIANCISIWQNIPRENIQYHKEIPNRVMPLFQYQIIDANKPVPF